MRHMRFWLAAVAAYTAFALAYSWPLPLHMAAAIAHDEGDPLLNAWILRWTASHTPLTAAWWNAPAFAPMTDSLALSEHLLGLWPVAAPLLAVGVPPLAVYNALFIASPALCALGACLLVVRLTGSRAAGAVAGCLYGFAPYRLEQLAHLQILASWWGPVALLALHQQAAVGGWQWAWLFALSWLLLVLTSGYHLVFFSLVAAVVALWLFAKRGMWARVRPVAVTTACTAVILAPVLIAYARAHAHQGLTRQPAEIDAYSADVLHLGTRPHLSRLWPQREPVAYGEIALFPGVALPAGVLIAGVVAMRRREAPAETADALSSRGAHNLATVCALLAVVPLATAAIAALAPGQYGMAGLRFSLSTPAKSLTVAWVLGACGAVLSGPGQRVWRRRSPLALYVLVGLATWIMTLGPKARVGGVTVMYHAPYAWLMALPGGLAMRVPPRFWLWTVLALAVVTGFGVAGLRRRAPRAGLAVAALLCALALADGWPVAMPLGRVPAAAEWTGGTVSPRVLELPLGDATRDVAAMWRGLEAGRAVVNGYSGYDPVHYQLLERVLDEGQADVLTALAEPDGLVVSVDGGVEHADTLKDMLHRAGATAHGGSGGWETFTLAGRTPAAGPTGLAVAPRRVTSLDGEDVTGPTTDADRYTRWQTGAPQRVGQGVVIEFAAPVEALGIDMGLGAFGVDHPARLLVEAEVDGVWQVVFDGPTAAAAFRGALLRPTDPHVVLALEPVHTRRLRLRAGADHPRTHWSISSIAVVAAS